MPFAHPGQARHAQGRHQPAIVILAIVTELAVEEAGLAAYRAQLFGFSLLVVQALVKSSGRGSNLENPHSKNFPEQSVRVSDRNSTGAAHSDGLEILTTPNCAKATVPCRVIL